MNIYFFVLYHFLNLLNLKPRLMRIGFSPYETPDFCTKTWIVYIWILIINKTLRHEICRDHIIIMDMQIEFFVLLIIMLYPIKKIHNLIFEQYNVVFSDYYYCQCCSSCLHIIKYVWDQSNLTLFTKCAFRLFCNNEEFPSRSFIVT